MANNSPSGSTPKLMDRRNKTDSPALTGIKRRRDSQDEDPTDSRSAKRPVCTLNEISMPPTEAELQCYADVDPADLPIMFKRRIDQRIFVNRDINLEQMEFYGFDMDYTLADYNSPDYEELTCSLVLDRLISMGYPKDIKTIVYDGSFPIRGLVLDTRLGNLLKLDSYGNILDCVHAFKRFDHEETQAIYPSLFINSDEIGIGNRYYVFDTLFALPEAYLYSAMVEKLESTHTARTEAANGDGEMNHADMELSYLNLHLDLRSAVDGIHNNNSLKKATVENMDKYIRKQPNLGLLLNRMRERAKVFLLTNSEFEYTNKVMDFLLRDSYTASQPTWRAFFDINIVGARKPNFFGKGTTLREVDITTGHLKIGKSNRFEKDKVYQGGSLEKFYRLTGCKGHNVLYIGDHIFGDIIKSKAEGWHTLLVVRELDHEIESWKRGMHDYTHLANLEFMLAEVYRDLNANSREVPDSSALRKHIRATLQTLNAKNNAYFGSPFRAGSKQTFFAMQVQRYADLYAASFINLMNYPLIYQFQAADQAMPHERDAKRDLHIESAASLPTPTASRTAPAEGDVAPMRT